MSTSTLQGKSMFGTQALSSRRSTPSYGFGSSTRSHADKVYMGPEHAKTMSMSVTPGPLYDLEGACQEQANSGKVSPPQWGFGTQARFSGQLRKHTPGPGSYNSNSSFGTQRSSHNTSYPLYGFGAVDRNTASKVRTSADVCPL